jgi:hypothetical protein
MRKYSAILSIVAVMCLVPQAFAYDCNTRVHLQYTGWDYAINHLTSSSTECWTPGSNAPAWNSTVGMWEFDDYYQAQIDRVISVPSETGSTNWDTLLYVDFYEPCAHSDSFFSVIADVLHNGSHTITTQYGINAYNSTSDSGYKVGYFTAANGDTVTISIVGAAGLNCSGGHIYFKDVSIQRAE